MPEVYCTSSLLKSFLRPLLDELFDVLSCDLTLHLAESPEAHTCLRNLVMGELWKWSMDGTWQLLLLEGRLGPAGLQGTCSLTSSFKNGY